MPRKTSADLELEAKTLLDQAKQRRAAEAKQERAESGYRQRLLGVYLERAMRTDAALRARVEVDMLGFCTRPRDRELFRLDERETWFDALTESATESAKVSKAVVHSSQNDLTTPFVLSVEVPETTREVEQ